MKYKMKAHPTTYAGVNFRSRLEARWAAFFNCMKWTWQYEPCDLEKWSPDFRVKTPQFDMLAEVKPYFHIEQFKTHPCWELGLCLGIDPSVTYYTGGSLAIHYTPSDLNSGWVAAGNLTQWKKKRRRK